MSDTQMADLDRKQVRSHSNFITVDRPDSSQLVDLHVYFLPRSFWKDKQNLAYNDAMEEAISAGFIRVRSNLDLRTLRNEIEVQCGAEELIPKEYIFLRSVGRAMTRVKDKQEYELKVKNFRPPQTYAPEIFLLEGRHEEFNVPATPLSIHSPSGHTFMQSRTRLIKNGKSPSRIDDAENVDLYEEQQWKKNQGNKTLYSNSSIDHINTRSYDVISSNNTESWKTSNVKEFQKLQEEQERLKKRQNELERLRQEMERKKKLEDDEMRRKKQLEDQQLLQQQRQRQSQMELLAKQKAEAEAATKIQSSYRGYRDRKKVDEIKRQQQQQKQLQNYRNQQQQQKQQHEKVIHVSIRLYPQ